MSCRAIAIAALLCAACRGTELAAGPDLGERLEVSFEGAATQSRERLEAVVQAELVAGPSREITKAQIDDAAFALELFYRGAGHLDAEVAYEFEPREGERPRARFQIREGPLVAIREVALQGLEHVEPDELAGLLGEVRVGAPFTRTHAARAAGALRSNYLERGYLAVEVDEPGIERLADDAVRVTLSVREGPRHALRAVSITGSADGVAAELERLAAEAVGRTFVPHLAYELRANVLRAHGNAGYPDCTVTIETAQDAASGAVDLALRAEPGPHVSIAAIDFRGDSKLPGRRLRGRIALEPGDPYDAERIERSFQDLYATGLFDSVHFELEGTGSERTLLVETVEAPSLQFFVEPGYGSYEGLRVRAGVDENNLFSSGRRGRLEGWYSNLARGVELGLADPFLFRAPITGELTFFARNREEPSFTVDELGGAFALRREWTREFSTALGIELSDTELSDVAISASVPPQFVESEEIGELTFALSYDTRDSVLLPKRGGLARFHSGLATSALGSSLEAFENGLDLAALVPFDERTQLAVRASTALIAPYGDTDDIPLQRRLFNGGENTVRSFREDELGPTDVNGEPVGGEARSLLSFELRRRLGGNVSGALFYDTGNVELDWRDYLEFDGFRHGIGIGLRYLLPIGPLRLDAAWNPDHRSGEDEWVVHFAVGLP